MPLTINNESVLVTKNVDLALRHIRHPTSSLVLWIDAVCIDQQDLEEKAHQISLMHRIYKQCRPVYIWLGLEQPLPPNRLDTHTPNFHQALKARISKLAWRLILDSPVTPPEYSSSPLAFIDHFAEDKHNFQLPGFRYSAIHRKYIFKPIPAYEEALSRLQQALAASWHTRFWCVQEALLPSEATVIYGDYRFSFATACKALHSYERHMFTCCADTARALPQKTNFCPDALYTVNRAESTAEASLCSMPTLDFLIRAHRYKRCSDPKDKVFGILALAPRTEMPIELNYALTVEDVYTNAMRSIISRDPHDLRCLTGAGFSSKRKDLRLPSWVRDLDMQLTTSYAHREIRRLEAYELYNACGSSRGKATLCANNTLQLRGTFLDTVRYVCCPMDAPSIDADGDPNKNANTILSWCKDARDHGCEVSLLWPDVRRQSFWKAIVAELIFETGWAKAHRLRSRDIDSYQSWLRQTGRGMVIAKRPPVLNGYSITIGTATYGRSLFVTAKGKLGLCYPHTAPGDEVWVVDGGLVPFIPRKAESTSHTEHGPVFQLVGDCYMQDSMDGAGLPEKGSSVVTIV